MTSTPQKPSLEEVLEAFSMEDANDHSTLDRYLRNYPSYATELIDLSRELSRESQAETPIPTPEEEELIEAAWDRVSKATAAPVADPFSTLSGSQIRALADNLDVPRLLFTAIRERRIRPETFPSRFIAQVCADLNRPIDSFMQWISLPGPVVFARAYKANTKPVAGEQVSFETLLVELGVDEATRRRLLEEDN